MTSHASVNVMLALEDAFDVEFPDEMLKRSVFESVASITDGARPARSAGRMTRRGRSRRRVPRRRRPRSPTRSPPSHADDVDRQARFPVEAVDALREQRALSALRARVARRRRRLASTRSPRRASSSAAAAARARWSSPCTRSRSATIVRHLGDGRVLRGLPAPAGRRAAADRLRRPPRSAPAATWASPSPRSRRSTATAARRFEKQAPTVSYGAHADDLLTTLRAHPDAEPGDQVAVLHARRRSTELEPHGTWDPLGMRGTCSPGFVVARRRSTPSRRCRRRSRRSPPRRWSRSPTCCGRTSGWASPPTRSTAPARSSRAAAQRAPGEPVAGRGQALAT